jgi:hypothetical protein
MTTKEQTFMTTQNLRLTGIVFTVGLLLLIPAIAMRFTDEVNWTRGDFIVAGLLLLSTGLSCELAIRTAKKTGYRIVLCGAILGACFLLWVELATGFFSRTLAGH